MAMNQMTMDVLMEIGNVGAGNAASALASMLDSKITVGLPSCEMVSFGDATKGYTSPEELVAALAIQLSGELEGYIMMILPLDDTLKLIERLVGESVDHNMQDYEKICETLQPMTEIANIVMGAYLTAIANFTNLKITPSVPVLSVDMVGAVMNLPVVVYGEMGDSVLRMASNFSGDGAILAGQYYLIPTMESSARLMKALGLE